MSASTLSEMKRVPKWSSRPAFRGKSTDTRPIFAEEMDQPIEVRDADPESRGSLSNSCPADDPGPLLCDQPSTSGRGTLSRPRRTEAHQIRLKLAANLVRIRDFCTELEVNAPHNPVESHG